MILSCDFKSFRVFGAQNEYSNHVGIFDCADEELDKANIELFAGNGIKFNQIRLF